MDKGNEISIGKEFGKISSLLDAILHPFIDGDRTVGNDYLGIEAQPYLSEGERCGRRKAWMEEKEKIMKLLEPIKEEMAKPGYSFIDIRGAIEAMADSAIPSVIAAAPAERLKDMQELAKAASGKLVGLFAAEIRKRCVAYAKDRGLFERGLPAGWREKAGKLAAIGGGMDADMHLSFDHGPINGIVGEAESRYAALVAAFGSEIVNESAFHRFLCKGKEMARGMVLNADMFKERKEVPDRKVDYEFLERFVPKLELLVLKETLRGEERGPIADSLKRLQRQISAMPSLGAVRYLPLEDIKIGMHYFHGGTDIWLYELDLETLEGEAFVCLNGDSWNAETGPVYLPEYLAIDLMQLDLFWDTRTTLKEVMDKVKGR